MAVEILTRDLGELLREMTGSDGAYDVHPRRVFLRTGLAEHDAVDPMVGCRYPCALPRSPRRS